MMKPKVVKNPLWKQRVKPPLELMGPESICYNLVPQMSHETLRTLISSYRQYISTFIESHWGRHL